GYPGGPAIDRAAREGDPKAFDFPRAKIPDAPYDFSFSGLKSTVLNLVNQYRMKQDGAQTGDGLPVNNIAASFQKAVVDVLTQHTMEAVRDTGVKKVAIAGGVASNTLLRESLEAACRAEGCDFFRPAPVLCTDNAAMIAGAAYFELQRDIRHDMSLNAKPNLPLGERERRFHGVNMQTPAKKNVTGESAHA
ncbi:MAG: hypothetical protein IJP92_01395, partial [Lachnospiraceae bacterium]|nr:hypothetical protein [Lachnospiraceae bacterium]